MVGLGQKFELDAAATGDSHLPSDTWLHVLAPNDTLLQSVRFHTSCSQPLRAGDRLGASLLVETVGEEDAEDGDYCPYGSKPSLLLLCYTGDGCDATQHSQDSGKVTCDGDPDAAPLVWIRASDKGNPLDEGARVFFEGFVELGAAFPADAAAAGESRLTNDMYLHVHDPAGNVLQTVKVHTSCSQPMKEGDQYGSLSLLGCQLENGPDPEDLCAHGRPRRMTLQYLGHGCGPVVAAPKMSGQRRVGAETGWPRGKGIGVVAERPRRVRAQARGRPVRAGARAIRHGAGGGRGRGRVPPARGLTA